MQWLLLPHPALWVLSSREKAPQPELGFWLLPALGLNVKDLCQGEARGLLGGRGLVQRGGGRVYPLLLTLLADPCDSQY